MQRPSFRPLSRDYWHSGVSYPAGRTLLAFLLAPAVTVALFLLLLFAAEVGFGGAAENAMRRALEFAPIVLAGTCVILWTGGALAFLALWTLRLRGRLAFALAGMLVGLGAAVALPMLGDAPRTGAGDLASWLVPIVVMTVHFGVAMLVLRIIAGVRRIHE